jgi:hypothetical protein
MVVTKLFALVDQNELVVHIASFDWDFRDFGPVELRFGNEKVHCRYVASGTEMNEAVLKLALDDPRYETVSAVAKKYDDSSGIVLIERSPAATNDVTRGKR